MEGFMCYAEKNQKLKGNFENHTRTKRLLLSNKKEQITDVCKTMGDSQKH